LEIKKSLAKLIVTDFHSRLDAEEAAKAWTSRVQEGQTPTDIPSVGVKLADVVLRQSDADSNGSSYPVDDRIAPPDTTFWIVRLDKLLVASKLAESASDGARKIKAGSVYINDLVVKVPRIKLAVPHEMVIKVGRNSRIAARVTIQ
jgi:tyrosyl-tRNA synthetase